jgi:hypothetical protein
MTRYESKLRSEEREFLKANLETIEHVFGILERRTTKEYYYERDADKKEDRRNRMTSIEHISTIIQYIINEKDATEEG